mgnify:CR=1 FL=1
MKKLNENYGLANISIMKEYIVSYKSKGGTVALNFYKVKANNQNEAIKLAKEKWVKDWYYGEADAKKTLKRMTFYI